MADTSGSELLRAFLDNHGVGPVAAAKALGCTHPAVIEWSSGAKRPTAELRRAIAIWTGGCVPEDAWLRDEDRERLAAVVPRHSPIERRAVGAGDPLARGHPWTRSPKQ